MTPRRTPTHRPRPAIRSALVLLTSLALLAACSAPAPIPGIEVGLGTSTVAVVRGGSVDVDVTLTRSNGASGPVALSVTGLPANVTATFAPPSLDGAATTSVLTLTATAAAIEGTASLTVSADGAALSDEATLTLDVESLTVAGRVETLFDLPMVGVTVTSQGETFLTGADGVFELDGLSIPYDVTVSAAAGSGNVQVFEGLTTPAPVLLPAFAFAVPTPPVQTAALTGDVLGGAAVGVDRVVFLCAEGLDIVVLGCDTVAAGGTAYALGVSWYGQTTASIRVHALHMETAADQTPAAYLGYEAFDLTISDGDADVRDLALAPVATVLLEGSVAAAAGMTVNFTIGGVRFGPRLTMPVFGSPSVVGDVSLLMPALTGATYDITTVADGPTGLSLGWTVDHGLDFGSLTPPVPLNLGVPADAAVGVDLTTPFTSSGSATIRTYLFSGAGPILAVSTNRSSVTVPDPALGGFAFPAGAAYSWYVLGHGTTDADAALARSLFDYYSVFLLSGNGGPGFDQDGSFTFALDRGFTFAP